MISLVAFWILVGWCGTVPRRWWRFPPPPPPPDPWFISRIIGAVSGVIGGWGFTQMFGPSPEPWTSAVPAVMSAVGAFALSRVVTDIYEQFQGGANVPKG